MTAVNDILKKYALRYDGLRVSFRRGEICVSPGLARLDTKLYINDDETKLVLPKPKSERAFARVVLRFDYLNQSVRLALLGPSSALPDTQKTKDAFETVLADISLKNGELSIFQIEWQRLRKSDYIVFTAFDRKVFLRN